MISFDITGQLHAVIVKQQKIILEKEKENAKLIQLLNDINRVAEKNLDNKDLSKTNNMIKGELK